MNLFLYIFSKVFGSKIASWIDNDGEFNVAIFLILAVIPLLPIIHLSDLGELDDESLKYIGFGFIGLAANMYYFFKPYFNYLVVLNFIFWLLFFIFDLWL